jgi:hypothetical protein
VLSLFQVAATTKYSYEDLKKEMSSNKTVVPWSSYEQHVTSVSLGNASLVDKVASKLYTSNLIYAQLNKRLRETGGNAPEFRVLTSCLAHAIKVIPASANANVLYRGMHGVDVKSYVPGSVVTWNQFSRCVCHLSSSSFAHPRF